MSLRNNVSERVPVLLFDSTGAPKTGVATTDIKGGRVQLKKGDGSKSFLTLTAGSNWIEVDAAESPGLYELVLSATDTGTPGILTWSVQPAETAFRASVGSDCVVSAVWDQVRAEHRGAGTFGESDRLQLQNVLGHVKVSNNQLVIYNEDDQPLKTFNLRDIAGLPTSFQVTERIPV